ncbi:MAG TPA: LiaF-related protein [Bacteroidales bacterium]|nr:LiaF-related protein [Bacteroidales bacterium]HRZ76740.1 LiaF-related protein [Bacteroidales bacterium]
MNTWFFRRSFWGMLLIVIGSVWLIENVFDLDIPLFSILFSVALIVLGVALIRGYRVQGNTDGNTVFSEGSHTFSASDHGHSVIFGEAGIDLTSLSPFPAQPIELRCVFGEMRVRVPAGANIEVNAEAAFGSVQMPDGNSLSFGNRRYTNPLLAEGQPVLRINIHCVFGSVVMISA